MSIELWNSPNNDAQSSDDLPWAKDWAKGVKNPETPLEALTVYDGDKGLLVLTSEYKAFFFNKDAQATHLRQALEVWSKEQKAVTPLICVVLNQKKACLGINHSGVKVFWHKSEQSYYSVRNDGEAAPQANPFLKPNSPARPEQSADVVAPAAKQSSKKSRPSTAEEAA
ncbi:MAG TPA: hypothetical protein VJ327_11375 [Patescibacteria group bacterium]|nr:hypothetical protein [Patescibacteria group bacterium]